MTYKEWLKKNGYKEMLSLAPSVIVCRKDDKRHKFVGLSNKKIFEAGAKENIKLLSQHILELQADKGKLTDKIKELENKISELKANCDLAIEGRDVKIMELESELEQAKKVKVVEHFEAFGQCRDSRRIAGLEQQIEKMKSDVTEEIGFAKNFDELHTYCILNNLLNRWENEE